LSEFSDYIVFVDESGSPTLSPIDPNHPVFVLVFCIIKKSVYCDVIQPAVKRLKFDFFGHDMTVLHSREIRKRSGDFNVLMDKKIRTAFLARLDQIVLEAELQIISCVVDKRAEFDFSHPRHDPYYIAMRFCMNLLQTFLRQNDQHSRLLHIIAESRGKSEDARLMEEFDLYQKEYIQVSSVVKPYYRYLPCRLMFAEKKINSAGLQLADLFGHPIGRNAIAADQANHAFEIVRSKVFGKILCAP
jgi:hypothetical protein